MNEIRVLDLFSGIGGFALGLKRAGGFRTVAYCEIEPYCQEVLRARMLDGSLDTAPICSDIRKLDGKPWRGGVDLICGGFPCQDISYAGDGAGIAEGTRSGLWGEYARIICEIRPKLVIVENVAALLTRGLERVLGDLAAVGFDAWWDVIPASACGSYHERERVWIVAYSPIEHGTPRDLLEARRTWGPSFESGRLHRLAVAQRGTYENSRLDGEPPLDRLVHGFPDRVDRLSALGNAVVPQVVEWIGRRINESR